MACPSHTLFVISKHWEKNGKIKGRVGLEDDEFLDVLSIFIRGQHQQIAHRQTNCSFKQENDWEKDAVQNIYQSCLLHLPNTKSFKTFIMFCPPVCLIMYTTLMLILTAPYWKLMQKDEFNTIYLRLQINFQMKKKKSAFIRRLMVIQHLVLWRLQC